MRRYRREHDKPCPSTIILLAVGGMGLAVLGGACASNGWNPTAGLEQRSKPVSTTESPAAIVGGQPINQDDLFAVFAELSGASALRELALDLEIQRELQARGLAVSESDIESERDRLLQSFGPSEQSQDIARRVLDSRRLGPHRLQALLERNAGLRLLIDPPEQATDAAVLIAHAVRHGPKRRVRLMLLDSAETAAASRRSALDRADRAGVSAAFAETAVESSLDSTAAAGGLLGDVSVADPGLSDVLRREIDRLTPGVVSDILALDSGFALVLVEADVPADGVSVEDARDELAQTIADRTERLAMEALANDLIARADITPLSPGLRWSWRADGTE
ncbi:MAG: peptidylprolyl isomerase [Planctomycetota bacterium]